MEENNRIFIKEKKQLPQVFVVLIGAIIGGIIGGMLTYVVLEEKIGFSNVENKIGDTSSSNVKYEITKIDNPVVAIAKKVGPSTVGVKVTYMSQSFFGGIQEADDEGSGIIYSEDGYIITNYHVIESAINNTSATVTVTLSDGQSVAATVIGSDSTTDLAVIKIDKNGLTKAEFAESKKLEVGELAVAIGNPLGQELAGSVTVGYISALNRKLTADDRTYKLVQTDAAINPGNSGGALVNSEGKVVGINTVKIGSTGVEGIGFAIPSDDAIPIIKELIENKKIVRPYIGLSGININSVNAKRNNIVEGIYVSQVYNNTPAKNAGIQVQDIIIGVDGKQIKEMEELNEIKNTKKIGDTITLKINRAGKELDIKVTLASDDEKTTSVTN